LFIGRPTRHHLNMNIQFHKDIEVKAFDAYDIYLNGQHVGRITQSGNEWSVSLTLPTKAWSAHMYPTLEAAQEFVRQTIKDNT
jgi:hypothetical protein